VREARDAVEQLTETLRYKPESRRFFSRWCVSLEFFIDIILPTALLPWGRLMSISLWGKGGRCVGLKALPPSRADCHEIWKPQTQPSGTVQVCTGIALNFKTCSKNCQRRLLASLCLSVRPSAWNSAPTGRIFTKFDN
jgi:hypothetical protein